MQSTELSHCTPQMCIIIVSFKKLKASSSKSPLLFLSIKNNYFAKDTKEKDSPSPPIDRFYLPLPLPLSSDLAGV